MRISPMPVYWQWLRYVYCDADEYVLRSGRYLLFLQVSSHTYQDIPGIAGWPSDENELREYLPVVHPDLLTGSDESVNRSPQPPAGYFFVTENNWEGYFLQ